jgi:outer membrane protein assembly factor BamB
MQVGAAPKWDHNLGDLVLGQPYLQTESIVVACAQGSIQSLYMTGTPLWDFDPQDAVTPYIARSVEGAAYVCDRSGMFKAINRVGRELWRVNLGRPINYPPVVGWDGRVFIPVDSRIYCRTAAGLPLWDIDLGSPMIVRPMLDHAGSVAVVLQNRDFVRISQFSSVERVRLDTQPALIVSIKSGGEESYVLFSSSGAAEKITYNERAPKGGRLTRGSFPSLQSAPAAAVSTGDQIALTLRNGRVQLIDRSGRVIWTGDSHETAAERGSANVDPANAAMVFDERGIYVLSTRGATGFAADGRRRLIHKIEEARSVPGFSDEGMLYVCGKDRVFRAYKIDSRPRTVKRSRFYGPMPEGSYGMGNPPPSPWVNDERRWNEDEQERMIALIQREISLGQLGEREPAYVGYLMEMIGFFLNEANYSRVRPRVKPLQRVALIRLL